MVNSYDQQCEKFCIKDLVVFYYENIYVLVHELT